MRRWLIGGMLGLGLAALALVLAFRFFAFEILVTLNNTLIDPIGPNQVVTWAAGPAQAAAPAQARKPNIIVILADDLGHNDITAFGGGIAGGRAATPNIDSLARDGASFDRAYAAHATCAPSRAALLTGRYPARVGLEFNYDPIPIQRHIVNVVNRGGDPAFYPALARFDAAAARRAPPERSRGALAPAEQTLPELLRADGYRTLMVGKWHLGGGARHGPHAGGFDEWLGILSGAGLYLPPDDPSVVNARLDFNPTDTLNWRGLRYAVRHNGSASFRPRGYLTDYFGDEAVKAITANKNHPFMLYLSLTAPHLPLQALKSDYEALASIEDHKTRVYGAMIRGLDRNVGKVLEALKANGLDRNTLVVFSSDHGATFELGLPEPNRPFRGWKYTFFEGGIRVPLFMRWPAMIAPGTRFAPSVSLMDVFATSLAAAAVPAPTDRRIDGIDLLPGIRGESAAPPHPALVWRAGAYATLMEGDWKLQLSRAENKTWLFDLGRDPLERRNLAATEVDRTAHMRARLESWDRGIGPPPYPSPIEFPVRIDGPVNTPYKAGDEFVKWPL